MVCDESCERRFMDDNGTERLRRARDGFKRDGRAKRIPDHFRVLDFETLDECEEVIDILLRSPQGGRRSALRMTAAIATNDFVVAREGRHHGVPIVMVLPRDVHHHDRCTGSLAPIEDVYPVQRLNRHASSLSARNDCTGCRYRKTIRHRRRSTDWLAGLPMG